MALHNLSVILGQAANTTVNPKAQLLNTVGMMVAFAAIFYFVLIRPQQKRAKQQAEMLKSIKRGDKVVTTGGIIGIVSSVKEKSLTIKSDDSKFEITKAAVGDVLERSSDTSES